jgi:hypothetical protein
VNKNCIKNHLFCVLNGKLNDGPIIEKVQRSSFGDKALRMKSKHSKKVSEKPFQVSHKRKLKREKKVLLHLQ